MDNKELNNEELNNEVKEEINEIETAEEIAEETKKEEDSKALKFFKRILAGVVDQIISIALALLLIIVTDFVIHLQKTK